MERGTKRKAALAASSPNDNRASKRQKTPEPQSVQSNGAVSASAAASSAQNSVQRAGIRWVEQARKARDSSSNLIATDFLSLPSQEDFPDYYQTIVLPIAIDTIEAKILADEYPDVSAIESDIKRMIYNAKEYNEPGSGIFQNAERMRKMTHNFMKTNNPAYKDPTYQAKPTPLPEQGSAPVAKPKAPVNTIRLTTGNARSNEATPAIKIQPTRAASAAKTPTITIAARKSEAPVPAEAESTKKPKVKGEANGIHVVPGENLEGKTFQEAQEAIMEDLIHYKDEGGDLEVFSPFVMLPSRKITDYYQTIKEPTSLNGIRKRVKGVHGRLEQTGITDFRTWDAFEAEMKKVWENARTYNEDGSEIFELSKEFEQVVKTRLAEARKTVPEPPQPTLNLSVGKPPAQQTPGIRLNFGSSQKSSPGPTTSQSRTSATPGVSVDESALQRQQQAVKDATSGQKPLVNGSGESARSASSRPPSQSSSINGVKTEEGVSGQVPRRPSNGPPMANGIPAGANSVVNGVSAYNAPPPVPQQPASTFDNKFRQAGRDASSALISSVQIVSPPNVNGTNPYGYNQNQQQPPSQQQNQSAPLSIMIPASSTLSQQMVTLNLLPSQSHLHFLPTISPAVTNNSKRPYRLFVTADGTRISPSHTAYRVPVPGSQLTPGPGFHPSLTSPVAAGPGSAKMVNGVKGPTQVNGETKPDASGERESSSSTPIAGASSNATSNQESNPTQTQTQPQSQPQPQPQAQTQPPQLFDIKLNGPGVHRIEIECVAVAEGALGAGTLAGRGGLEMERISVYVSLLKGF